jgi:hypothetical protein
MSNNLKGQDFMLTNNFANSQYRNFFSELPIGMGIGFFGTMAYLAVMKFPISSALRVSFVSSLGFGSIYSLWNTSKKQSSSLD